MEQSESQKNRVIVQYAASPAVLEDIEAILAKHESLSLRSRDNGSVYALVPAHMALHIRRALYALSLRHAGEPVHLRWNTESYLDEAPVEAHVVDGGMMYPAAADHAIVWTGAWPDPGVRAQVNTALADHLERLGRIPGMEGVSVTLTAGDAQARGAAQGSSPRGAWPWVDGAALDLRNEYVAQLMESGQ